MTSKGGAAAWAILPGVRGLSNVEQLSRDSGHRRETMPVSGTCCGPSGAGHASWGAVPTFLLPVAAPPERLPGGSRSIEAALGAGCAAEQWSYRSCFAASNGGGACPAGATVTGVVSTCPGVLHGQRVSGTACCRVCL